MFLNIFQKRRRPLQEQVNFEIELLESREMLSCAATFFPNGQLNVLCGPLNAGVGEVIVISRDVSGRILLNGQRVGLPGPLTTATVNNTQKITILGGIGNDRIEIDQSNGRFGPGRVAESTGFSEIEFSVDGGLGNNRLVIRGSVNNDVIHVGENKINLNGDDDFDILFMNIQSNDPRGLQVFGGAGNDVLSSQGNSIVGAARSAFLIGESGNDNLFGGSADDELDGGPGNDTLRGGDGNDRLFGSDGNDFLAGDSGEDLLEGQGGKDTLIGGLGDDFIEETIDDGNSIIGDSGIDTWKIVGTQEMDFIKVDVDANGNLFFNPRVNGVIKDLNSGRQIEKLIVAAKQNADQVDLSAISVADRQLAGITKIEILDGNDGSPDIYRGSQGADVIFAGGLDVALGLGGNDFINAPSDVESIDGGPGNDRLEMFHPSSNDGGGVASGGTGNDILVIPFIEDNGRVLHFDGGDGNDQLIVNLRTDVIENITADRLAATNELVIVQTQSTRIFGKNVEGQIQYTLRSDRLGGVADKINFSLLSAADLAALGLSGSDIIVDANSDSAVEIRGTQGTDHLVGGRRGDLLFGFGGDDLLEGLGGNDVLRGGDGDDELRGGGGNDQLFGENGNDTLDGGPGNNLLDEGPGQGGILFRGTSGDDVIEIRRRERNGVNQVIFELNGKRSVNTYRKGETVIVFAGDGDDVVEMKSSAGSHWRAFFDGQRGDDVLIGSSGNDQLDGSQGNDVLIGKAGDDLLRGDAGRDVLLGGLGNDVLIGSPLQDLLAGKKSNRDVLKGGSGNNVIVDELF